MKTLLIALIAISSLLSCSGQQEKGDLVKSHFKEILADNVKWKKSIERSLEDSLISQKEIRRLFFQSNPTISHVYREVGMIHNYFDLSDQLLKEYRSLLDEKNNLLGVFYSCKDIDEENLESLLLIENKIIQKLEQIDSLLSDQ